MNVQPCDSLIMYPPQGEVKEEHSILSHKEGSGGKDPLQKVRYGSF